MEKYQLLQSGAQVQKDLNALESLADEFSASSTYEVGDVVRYDGAFYKCITAISTAGAWDSTKWEQLQLDNIGGGGGTQLYQHSFTINGTSKPIKLISLTGTALSGLNDLSNVIVSNNYIAGTYYSDNVTFIKIITAYPYMGGNLNCACISYDSTSGGAFYKLTISSMGTDTVTEL